MGFEMELGWANRMVDLTVALKGVDLANPKVDRMVDLKVDLTEVLKVDLKGVDLANPRVDLMVDLKVDLKGVDLV